MRPRRGATARPARCRRLRRATTPSSASCTFRSAPRRAPTDGDGPHRAARPPRSTLPGCTADGQDQPALTCDARSALWVWHRLLVDSSLLAAPRRRNQHDRSPARWRTQHTTHTGAYPRAREEIRMIWLTQETFDQLKAELEDLRGPVRAEIVERISAARDEGDLKENGGYHAARTSRARTRPASASSRTCSSGAEVGETAGRRQRRRARHDRHLPLRRRRRRGDVPARRPRDGRRPRRHRGLLPAVAARRRARSATRPARRSTSRQPNGKSSKIEIVERGALHRLSDALRRDELAASVGSGPKRARSRGGLTVTRRPGSRARAAGDHARRGPRRASPAGGAPRPRRACRSA